MPCVFVGLIVFIAYSYVASEVDLYELSTGFGRALELIQRMLPPDFSKPGGIFVDLLETFFIAVAATFTGGLIAMPMAWVSSRRHSPHPWAYGITRGIIAVWRTVPDLIWALVFIVIVGLGPFAGMLALTIDAAAFCARFFAESFEESDPEPEVALKTLGMGPLGVYFTALLPGTMPALTNTWLFALERATRGSTILGLVGAGGIGLELTKSFDLMAYDRASALLISVLLLVVCVERTSALIRKRILGGE